MSFLQCSEHTLIQNIIFCENSCISLNCLECFRGYEDAVGLILKQESKKGFIEWNQFLVHTLHDYRTALKNQGFRFLFNFTLSEEHPEYFINDEEINSVGEKVLEIYASMLKDNIEFVSRAQNLQEIQVPQLMKDLYIMFVHDINRNLVFLIQTFQKQLRKTYPQNKLYKLISFSMLPEKVRQLSDKKLEIIEKYQKQIFIRFKPIKSPILKSKLYNSQNSPLTPQSFNTPSKSLPTQSSIHLREEIEILKNELNLKNKSIVFLHNLIGNEEEELSYRENQVQVLTEEIRKLMKYKEENPKLVEQLTRTKQQLKDKENKIMQLTQIISKIKENQFQILEQKNIYEKYDEAMKQLSTLRQQLSFKDKSIKYLNNLIGNEEQQLFYRENQVQTLTKEIQKLMKKNENIAQLQSNLIKKNEEIRRLSDLICWVGKQVPQEILQKMRHELSQLQTVIND